MFLARRRSRFLIARFCPRSRFLAEAVFHPVRIFPYRETIRKMVAQGRQLLADGRRVFRRLLAFSRIELFESGAAF